LSSGGIPACVLVAAVEEPDPAPVWTSLAPLESNPADDAALGGQAAAGTAFASDPSFFLASGENAGGASVRNVAAGSPQTSGTLPAAAGPSFQPGFP